MNPQPSLPPTVDAEPTPPALPLADTLAEAKTTPNANDPNRTTAYPASDTPVSFPTIPGFQIEAELGRGGMGVVYKARQTGLDRTVALKMILKADFATPEQKLRFQIEAENAARVQHPNIVQVYEIGEHQGQPYFALEFVAGGSLADRLGANRVTPSAAAALTEKLARAMHAAHSQGIIHRDLKPANVLLDGQGNPKIADFGLAKRLDATDDLTGSGAIMGTPSYMAPEQARGDTKHVGPAADQYSLGVIFYQLLTNRLPFEAVSVPALLKKIVEEEPTAPTARNAAVPADLSIICLKCLEKDPAKRYPTTEALAEDLRNWREHRPITARPATRTERVVKWCRRYPAVAALILVSVLAAIIASGLAVWAVGAERTAAAERDQKEIERTKAIAAAEKERLAKEEAERNLGFARKGNEILGSVFTGLDPKTTYETVAELRDALKGNLTKAIEQLEGSAIGDPLEVAAMQNTLGKSLLGLGEPALAITVFEKALATRRATLGPDHPATLTSMNNLASGYRDAGKNGLALPLYEETLRLMKAKLGPDHFETLTCMNNLAVSYQSAGKVDQALTYFEEALRMMKAQLGSRHPSTLNCINNLAICYKDADKLDQALPLFEEVLRLRQLYLGPDHPHTLASMHNLARGYADTGRLDRALPLFEENLQLRKAKLGPYHPDTHKSMNSLANVYENIGRSDLALPIYEELVQLAKVKFGPNHLHTLIFMNNLAKGYQSAGKRDKALTLLEETLQLMKAELGHDDSYTLKCMGHLGKAYCDSNQGLMASAILQEFVNRSRKRSPPLHPGWASLLAQVSVDLLKCDQYATAEEMLREALTIREAKEPDAWTTFNTMSMLGGALLGQQKYADAEPLLIKGYEGMKERLASPGSDSQLLTNQQQRLTEALDRLIDLYTALEKPDEVKKWQAERERLAGGK